MNKNKGNVYLNIKEKCMDLIILKNRRIRSSHVVAAVMNLTSIHEDSGSIPGLAQWVGDLVLPCAVVQVTSVACVLCGCGIYRLAATALIRPLA